MQKSLRKRINSNLILRCREIVDKWYGKRLIRRALHEAFYDDYGLLYYYIPNNYKKFHGGHTARKIECSREKTRKSLMMRRLNRSREQVDKDVEHLRSEESIKYVWKIKGDEIKNANDGR